MTSPVLDDDAEEKPLDPAVERVRRRLVRFVAINLGLLFLALMAVVVAIVYRAGRSEPAPEAAMTSPLAPPTGEMLTGEIPLPGGSRLLGKNLEETRLLLDVELAGGGRALFLYDLAERRMIGRYDLVERAE